MVVFWLCFYIYASLPKIYIILQWLSCMSARSIQVAPSKPHRAFSSCAKYFCFVLHVKKDNFGKYPDLILPEIARSGCAITCFIVVDFFFPPLNGASSLLYILRFNWPSVTKPVMLLKSWSFGVNKAALSGGEGSTKNCHS